MHSFKIISILLLLLVVIFAFAGYTNHVLLKTSQEIEKHVDQLEASIKDGDWGKTTRQLEAMEAVWEKTEKKWTVLIDHVEIDTIDISLARMSNYIEAKAQAPALAEAGALKRTVRHIPDKETLKLKNIF